MNVSNKLVIEWGIHRKNREVFNMKKLYKQKKFYKNTMQVYCTCSGSLTCYCQGNSTLSQAMYRQTEGAMNEAKWGGK